MFPKWPSGRSKIEPNRLLKLTKIVPFCVKFDNKLKIAAYSSRGILFWSVLDASQIPLWATMASQDTPGCNPEAPRHRQDAPTRPKTHRDDPKTPEDAPKTLPRRLQQAILPDFQCQNWIKMVPKSDKKSTSTLKTKNQLNASRLDFSWFCGVQVGTKNQ